MTLKPPKKQASKKRNQILSQAVQLFNDSGYHDTRLEDIANELGKVKTSVSYHFQSKEALLEEALTVSFAFTERELDAAETQATGLESVLHLLRQRATAHTNALAGLTPPVVLFSDIETINDISKNSLKFQFHNQIERVRSFIQRGCNDKSINVHSTEAATFFLMNILHWLPGWLASIPNARHMSAIDGLCDLIRNGIAIDRDRVAERSISHAQPYDYPEIFDRTVRNKIKRDALLRTGTRFLNERGFRNLSLSDVANELGVTRGAFYYYIEDKDALLESSFDRTCETIEKALTTARANNPNDSLEVIEQTLRTLFEGHITDLNPLTRMNLLSSVDPIKRVAIEAKFKRIRASFSEVIAEAMVDNSARTIDLDALENLLMGSIFNASQWRLSVTPLQEAWKPKTEPISASAAYFQPLIVGLAGNKNSSGLL